MDSAMVLPPRLTRRDLCLLAVAWASPLGGGNGAHAEERPAGKPVRNEALRRTLVQMGRDDQMEIEDSLRTSDPVPGKSRQRQQLLRQILAEFGWPRISVVGEDGANGAWLVAQHADDDVPFQRHCLTLMEQAHRQGEASGKELAYLTDRVLVNERRPQIYGTQGSPFYDPATRATVDARRRKLGLPSMAESARATAPLIEKAYRRLLPNPRRVDGRGETSDSSSKQPSRKGLR